MKVDRALKVYLKKFWSPLEGRVLTPEALARFASKRFKELTGHPPLSMIEPLYIIDWAVQSKIIVRLLGRYAIPLPHLPKN